MPVELRLPQLADTVTSAKLAVWLKQEGEAVAAGEPLVEVETDKTTIEIEAPASGVIRKIHVPAGADGLETGALLAVIDDDGDADQPDAEVEPAARSGPTLVPAAPAAERQTAAAPGPEPVAGDPEAPAAQAAGRAAAATPLARRMAAAAGLDLGRLRGTGQGGRIGKADVERALAAQRPAAADPPAAGPDARGHAPPLAAAPAGFREEPLSTLRRVTAERMQTTKQTVPHFYLGIDCAVDAALQLRARINRRHPGLGLTLTGIIVRAAALALRQVPAANSSWADGGVRLHDAVDVAVAVETPQGLIAPVVRHADRKGLRAIAEELATLRARAREGALTPAEYAGGTFTISNLGMHGVDSLYAIVNAPQSCILGVGAARPRPVAAGDTVAIATVAACTLSADHRALDGATGAELLAALRAFIEEPGLLAL